MTKTQYVCLCCGYRTFAFRPEGTYMYCEVCLWTDDPDNRHQILWFQNTFLEHGSCDLNINSPTRQPTKEEARPSWWFPLSKAYEYLGPKIRKAFSDTSLDGGTTLQMANHHISLSNGIESHPTTDVQVPHWSRLETTIEQETQISSLIFMDNLGIRYYLPAYMMHWIKNPENVVYDVLLWCLERRGKQERFTSLLTHEQHQAVALFLAWLVFYHPITYGFDASEALKIHWKKYLSEDHRLQLGL